MQVFENIKTNLNYLGNSYNMFGHSAGAQFVHRFIQFKPLSRVDKAVSANAGWYTLPDTTIDFPYGLKGRICIIRESLCLHSVVVYFNVI